MESMEKIMTLEAIQGIGRRAIHHAYEFFGGFEQASIDEILRFVQMLHKDTVQRYALDQAYRKKDRILEVCQKSGIKPISFDHPSYPNKFSRLDSRPSILYVKGDECLLSRRETIGIIGTRRPSREGRQKAFRFAGLAGGWGLTVISGLAAGCDSCAHLGSMETLGKTVAVLPGGINRIYPEENQGLAEKIVDYQGALVSEYEPNEMPEQYKFVARDRLQAVFSRKMLVVETDIVGGTMHTVNFVKDYGRDLGVVGYSNMEMNCRRGNRVLLVHPDYYAKCIENDGDMERFIHEKR